MKHIINILMVAIMFTAFVVAQDKQTAPIEPTKYATEKAELIEAYKQLLENKATIEKQITNVVFTVNWLEAKEQEANSERAEPEETK